MQLLKDVPRVIVFNLKEPRRWEEANNLIIEDTVRRYPNTVLIDWRSASSSHPEYFGKDGIHIGAVGARAYTLLIVEGLRPWLSADTRRRSTGQRTHRLRSFVFDKKLGFPIPDDNFTQPGEP